jgi:hypothetical protein
VLYDKKHLFFEMSFHYSTRAVVTISKLWLATTKNCLEKLK